MNKCKDCKFFQQEPNGPNGQCRKNPPVYAFLITDYQSAVWPHVMAYDWCGEWMRIRG